MNVSMTSGDVMNTIICGDAPTILKTLPANSVQCCVTSPPYFGLRDYGVEGQIGLEETPDAYVAKLIEVFQEVRRVLRDDGTLWLNLGDSYACGKRGRDDSGDKGKFGGPRIEPKQRPAPMGFKPKDLIGIPWRVAFALQSDDWYLRSDIVWHKTNAMPESVKDRPTKAHEYVFLLSKSEKYFYNADVIREPHTSAGQSIRLIGGSLSTERYSNATPDGVSAGTRMGMHPQGRNKRSVWSIPTKPYNGAHFAVMPTALVEPCILAGSRPGDIILDPFAGSGTVPYVALQHGRRYIGIELNADYIALTEQRLGTIKK